MQAEDVQASFLFIGDLNSNHQEWLNSAIAYRLFLKVSEMPLCLELQNLEFP